MTDPATETINQLLGGSSEALVVANRGAVRLLVFNRPDKRNAMTSAMRRDFASHMAQADADPAVRCVIVTGAHGCFTAGVDIKERPLSPNLPLVRPHPVEACRGMSKPVIAMIDGLCLTGGLELALACTFLIGSDRSSYADTHLKIGIFPGWGGVSLLTSAIGARRAAQLQLTGERISAEVAARWGLISEVVPPAELLPRCLQLAELIASADPHSCQRYVTMNRRIDGMDRDHALALELVELERLRATAAHSAAATTPVHAS